ncbi:hypothetical protein UFOVP806_45 [uncultured Caudovirales phage]|uniref:Uncharacterized protein n=1 Tax=uncultured Caudovirales phage TaxID=2100421 RepID=A0A6J5P319_9CAUD|nr:hypothetical protein UFOVP806_45 [uncultured Caudovirales phage]
MQICDILLRISPAESSNTTIGRQNVTPAEIAVLRHMKGPNAVTFNGNLREVKRSSAAEGQRLQAVHGSAFTDLFPGMSPSLPQSFDQVEFDVTHIPAGDPYVPGPDEAPILESPLSDDEPPMPSANPSTAVRTKPGKRAAKQRETFA